MQPCHKTPLFALPNGVVKQFSEGKPAFQLLTPLGAQYHLPRRVPQRKEGSCSLRPTRRINQ
jgi:hypothetical protein